ncbi:hypothetical protein HDF19_15330 [Mucilaginibacter sp. E4BP6]|uniref:hypothetical protein n=1 Tax=Mucilaginibacter sp. E4BP6 TaxID=2723089 RepID=UPI0015CC8891|nr:hypothetical protein [Mucilaginibacter sp. E4BP6]NYE65631.1 hypothetical protein [Mucilaginibacter sp. E4BP6]
MKHLLVFIPLILFLNQSFAQHTDESNSLNRLNMYQDSLADLGKVMINNDNELERQNANTMFVKTLVAALKVPNSFLFPFDSVKTVSILNSPDNRFRILSWHIMNDDGSYRFYGALQLNTGGPLKLFPLVDYSPLLEHPEDSVTDNRKWYGAQYYKIIRVTGDKSYYVLLGWKGYTVNSTKKVIEVLSFKNDKPVFGMEVFGTSKHTRIIFQYTRQASMLLKYVPEQDLIVFDHLSPPDDKSKKNPETFGPDLSYDGYKLINGRWKYEDNLDMRNVPDEHDNEFTDPKKQAIEDRSSIQHN